MCIIEYRGIYIRITKNIMSGTCGLGAGTHQKFSKVLYSSTCITFGYCIHCNMHCIIVLMYHVGIDDFENRICMYTKLNRTFKLLKMVMYRLCPLLRVLFCTHVAQWSSKWGRSMPHFWIEYRFFKRSKLAKITTIKK